MQNFVFVLPRRLPSRSFVNEGSERAIYLEANMGHLADVQLGPCG
jgi:hypothetical protein